MNVVLVEPEIPPNTGNVARLCAATQATLHLVGPLGFRLDDKTLKRAGMDYWEHVTWKYWESLERLRESRQSRGGIGPRFYYVTTKSKRPVHTAAVSVGRLSGFRAGDGGVAEGAAGCEPGNNDHNPDVQPASAQPESGHGRRHRVVRSGAAGERILNQLAVADGNTRRRYLVLFGDEPFWRLFSRPPIASPAPSRA